MNNTKYNAALLRYLRNFRCRYRYIVWNPRYIENIDRLRFVFPDRSCRRSIFLKNCAEKLNSFRYPRPCTQPFRLIFWLLCSNGPKKLKRVELRIFISRKIYLQQHSLIFFIKFTLLIEKFEKKNTPLVHLFLCHDEIHHYVYRSSTRWQRLTDHSWCTQYIVNLILKVYLKFSHADDESLANESLLQLQMEIDYEAVQEQMMHDFHIS